MILKLAKNGMKGKLSDYLILFTGLMASVAVFYMFLSLATNKDFITQNSVINSIQLVFVIGAILLAIITFFYVFYAQSFLFTVRKKEFGTYLLLGIKRKQIKKIASFETALIATGSILMGTLLGMLLSFLVSVGITKQLDVEMIRFHPFHLPAFLLTALYFVIVFTATSLWINRKIAKTPILNFIYADSLADEMPLTQKTNRLVMIAGVSLLIVGYFSLVFMENLREIGLFTAAFATTIATYLLFSSFLPMVVGKMKNSPSFYLKGLNTFTFSQLHFRMNELKRILATIAMLIALSAGAISGGFAFVNNAGNLVDEMDVYDVKLYDMAKKEEEITTTIPFTEQETYHFKMDEEYLYFSVQELNENPPLIKDEVTNELKHPKKLNRDAIFELDEWGQQSYSSDWETALYVIAPSVDKDKKVITQNEYEKLSLIEHTSFLGKTENFLKHKKQWAMLDRIQEGKYEEFGEGNYYFVSKFSTYETYMGFASGTFFMGFFLGISFLMMMASMLMFKILSSAHKDIHRYEMLRKIGVNKKTLTSSLTKELGLIFLFPSVLGLAHVLVGMNLFSFIIIDPYYKLWVSILIFITIYVVYYFITAFMYEKIVLPKESKKTLP